METNRRDAGELAGAEILSHNRRLPPADASCVGNDCPGGETGRRRGLKIPRRKACRFESGPGHQIALFPCLTDSISFAKACDSEARSLGPVDRNDTGIVAHP